MTDRAPDRTCVVCGGGSVLTVSRYSALQRVSSDCKPFRADGRLLECTACGAVQKPGDALWQRECDEIYGAYDNYGLTGGVEQSVRGGPDGGSFAPRSELVLSACRDAFDLPAGGRMLDYGCGRGPTARAAAGLLPGWTIDGYDLDRRAETELRAIPGFGTLYDGDPATIDARYDLIVLMHALEHIPAGHAVLGALAGLLTQGGRIVVQVPNRVPNPFDLLVADHTIHFDARALWTLAERSAVAPVLLSETWVTKELSLVLAAGQGVDRPPPPPIGAEAQVAWLARVAGVARDTAARRPFGIFGTSIVGTWIAAEAGTAPDFYIDEDPAKQGCTIGDVPIVAPEAAPRGAAVIPAMAPTVARAVAARLAPLGLAFAEIPAYPG